MTNARIALAEFGGTYLLVLVGTGAILLDADQDGVLGSLGVSVSFGAAVFLAILCFGRLSGAHINPAVSFGLALRDRGLRRSLPLYLGAQLAGAAAASLSLRVMAGETAAMGATLPSGSNAESLAVEIFISFLLMLTIFVLSREFATLLPIAIGIGAFVAFAAYIAGPVSGASMNPARSFGPALVSDEWQAHWLYWLGPLTGAALASLLYQALQSPATAQESQA